MKRTIALKKLRKRVFGSRGYHSERTYEGIVTKVKRKYINTDNMQEVEIPNLIILLKPGTLHSTYRQMKQAGNY